MGPNYVAPEEYMACGYNRYAALNHNINILHKALASQHPLRHQPSDGGL
jgi:hypothetical protein